MFEINMERKVIMEKAQTLQIVSIFKGLNADQLEEIIHICKRITYTNGETIFEENSSEKKMYIVLEGEVIIKMWVPDESKEVVLSKIIKGQIFGELILFDDDPRSASAVASSDVTMLIIEKENFLNLIQTQPVLGITV